MYCSLLLSLFVFKSEAQTIFHIKIEKTMGTEQPNHGDGATKPQGTEPRNRLL